MQTERAEAWSRREFLTGLTVTAGLLAMRVAPVAAENVEGGGYLIQNASLVLTMDPNLGDGSILGPIENADVLIVADHIAAVGANLAFPDGVRVIDGRGMIVMPGFVDTHDHLWQCLIRGCATDGHLFQWLGRCIFPLNGSPINEADGYAGTRLAATGLINTGVTTVVDWNHTFNFGFVRGSLRALNDSHLRYVFAMVPTGDGSDIRAAKVQFIDPNPLARLQIAGRTSPLAVTAAQTAVAKDIAGDFPGTKFHLHLLEQESDVANNPFAVMEAAGTFDFGRDLLFAHAIHVTDAEIDKLAQVVAAVSHQPLSNMRLASGIMRYQDMRDAGIRIGIGLDGGTNDTIDGFNNIRAATGLQRALSHAPQRSPTVEEVLRAATMGGAEVLDMESEIGSLTPGKQADVLVIDMNMLNFAPVLRPVAQIVFNGQTQNVKWVFVAGRVLKEDGKVKGVNERKLVEAAQAATDHITPFIQP
jgi:5-methylthioadenosine/S-adenosylhomocysteine deaminase